METYSVFVRNWYRRNPAWPGGREPGAGPKRYLRKSVTYDEARRICREYNDTHEPGLLSRKAEFEEVSA